jgi:hypothetical protein
VPLHVDLRNEARYPRQVSRALFDVRDAVELRKLARRLRRHVIAEPGLQVQHDGQRRVRNHRGEVPRGMPVTYRDRPSPVKELKCAIYQPRSLFRGQVLILLRLDPGFNNHGGVTLLNHMVHTPPRRRCVHVEAGTA